MTKRKTTPQAKGMHKMMPSTQMELAKQNGDTEFIENAKDSIRAGLLFAGAQRPKTDAETAERITDFFQKCVEYEVYPTLELLALALGLSDTAELAEWADGGSQGWRRAELVKKARMILRASDADLTIRGKLNAIVYFFRAKNYYGMNDSPGQQINIQNIQSSSRETLSDDEIRERLLPLKDRVEYVRKNYADTPPGFDSENGEQL